MRSSASRFPSTRAFGPVLTVACVFGLALGCTSVVSSENARHGQARLETPILAISTTAPWPFIHQGQGMTKMAPFCAPVAARAEDVTTTAIRTGPTILSLHGDRYLYVQTSDRGAPIVAYDPTTLQKVGHTLELGALYPDAGGGVIDNQGKQWWSAHSQIVRADEDLGNPIWSDVMPGDKYNGTTFLPDGNILATSMPGYSVVATTPEAGKFKVLGSYALTDLHFDDGLGNPTANAPFGPRPSTDGRGHYYFVVPTAAFRVTYVEGKLGGTNGNVDWVYRAPPGESYGISDGLLAGDDLCFVASPTPGIGMPLTCLGAEHGDNLRHTYAFAGSQTLASTWHTLGMTALGKLVVIGDAPDASGGVSLYEPSDLTLLHTWPLTNISQAFSISGPSGKIYLASKPAQTLEVDALDPATFGKTILYQGRSAGDPGKALGLIGTGGNLYVPTTTSLLQLHDTRPVCSP